MTKINVTRTFEKASLAKEQFFAALEPFVDYVNGLADNFIRILSNGVGIVDNMDATLKTISVKHNTDTPFAVSKRPVAIFVVKQASVTNPVLSFTWFFSADQEITVNTNFNGSPTDAIQLTLWIQYS